MPAEDAHVLQREGLRVFGRIAAGLSHELSNVFNIVNELAGLEQDIARAAEASGGASAARIADLAARIKAQVERAEKLNRLLHGFAHSIDEADAAFDLSEALELLAALAARAARLAKVELELTGPPTPITVEGDRFALLLAVFAMVDIGLGAAAGERRLRLIAESVDGGARVVLESADPLPPPMEGVVASPALALGIAAWGATLSQVKAAGSDRLVLTVPAAAPPSPPGTNNDRREDSHET